MPFERTESCYAVHRNLYFQGRPRRRRLRRVPISSWLVRNTFIPHLVTPSVPETAKLAVWVGFGISEPFCSRFRYRWVFSVFGRGTLIFKVISSASILSVRHDTGTSELWSHHPFQFPSGLSHGAECLLTCCELLGTSRSRQMLAVFNVLVAQGSEKDRDRTFSEEVSYTVASVFEY